MLHSNVGSYAPVDLTGWCNAGLELLAGQRQPPVGDQEFHGLPFRICNPGYASAPCFVVLEPEQDVTMPGGRLIFGVGAGYIAHEFEAVGVPFSGRGARVEEYLAAIRAIWTQEHPAYTGRTVSFQGVQARPRPLQQPTRRSLWAGMHPLSCGAPHVTPTGGTAGDWT